MFNIIKKINPFGNSNNNNNNNNSNTNNNIRKGSGGSDQSSDNSNRYMSQSQGIQKKKEDDVNLQIIEFSIDPLENVPRVFQLPNNGKPDEELVDYFTPPPVQKFERQKSSDKQQIKSEGNDQNINNSQEEQNEEENSEDDPNNYFQYKVTIKDTLYSIADKFQINSGLIMKINDLSGDSLFPGKVLQIPVSQNENKDDQDQKSMGSSAEVTKEQIINRQRSISQKLIQEQKQSKTYICSYCTGYGNILGKLQIQDQMIVFNPDVTDSENQKKFKKKSSAKFQACIDIKDVNEAMVMVLPPQMDQTGAISEDDRDYAIQICLSTINKEISNKYTEKLKKLKKEKKSISFVTFRIYEYNIHGVNYTQNEKQIISENIIENVNSTLKKYSEIDIGFDNHEQSSSTIVPFYDILYDNLMNDEHDEHESEKPKHRITLWETIGVTPKIEGESNIVCKEQFLEIVEFCVPSIFRLSNWTCLYSTETDGTSINTCLRNCEEMSPIIMLVKEFNKDNVFGAYLTDPIQTGFGFTGNAESCVFQYLQSVVVKSEKSLPARQEKQDDLLQLKQKEKNNNNNHNSSQNSTLNTSSLQDIPQDETEKIIHTSHKSVQNIIQNNEKKQDNSINNNNQLNEKNKQQQQEEEEQKEEEIVKFEFKKYDSSNKNTNFQFCDHEQGIGIGCGDQYAILIRPSFMKGSSDPSDTYDNPRMSIKRDFQIKCFEIWGIDYD